MRCPKCGSQDDKVVDSRLSKDGTSIRRRRECLDCDNRYTTYEEIERLELRVIKKDGRHEPFDRHKVLASFTKACEKRPIGMDVIEGCVRDIITELENEGNREISTRHIGAKVMEHLHAIDHVAYVRYASVYRSFQEIGDFIEEIQFLERKTARTSAQPDLFKA